MGTPVIHARDRRWHPEFSRLVFYAACNEPRLRDAGRDASCPDRARALIKRRKSTRAPEDLQAVFGIWSRETSLEDERVVQRGRCWEDRALELDRLLAGNAAKSADEQLRFVRISERLCGAAMMTLTMPHGVTRASGARSAANRRLRSRPTITAGS